jgi:cystathionine beta-lyase/cystathionine gamma-synthase
MNSVLRRSYGQLVLGNTGRVSFVRRHDDGSFFRCLSSSSDTSITTSPEEAGRKAADMAASMILNDAPPLRRLSPSTIMAHAGMDHGLHNAPMAPPLHFATTYTRPADGIYAPTDDIYVRGGNPTRLLLERTMFELECAGNNQQQQQPLGSLDDDPTTFAFSSGMMAATAIVLAHSAPLTVLVPDDVYHGVPTVLEDVFARHNVELKRIQMTNNKSDDNDGVAAIRHAIQSSSNTNDVIVWMETPSNPKCQVIDIRAVCQAVKEYPNVTTVVDATMASPVLTRPLEVST